jgi:hypothetical protein
VKSCILAGNNDALCELDPYDPVLNWSSNP